MNEKKGGDTIPEVGDVVIYFDHSGMPHNAVITAVWGPEVYPAPEDAPSLNLVYVSTDESKSDPFGRQIERDTSVPHRSQQKAHGNYWEEP